MKRWIWISCCRSWAGAWLRAAQQVGSPAAEDAGKLQRVQGGIDVQMPVAPQALDADAWRDLLSAAALNEREANYDRLLREARNNRELQTWLEARAAEPGELAWTARLALRELKMQDPLVGSPYSPYSAFGPGMRSMGDPFERMREMLGQDPFGSGMFGPDFGFPQGWDPFQSGFNLQFGPGTQSEGESYSIEMSPDKVRVECKTLKDGKEDLKVYEAENMEELLRQFPELKEHVGGGQAGLVPFGGPGLQRVPTPGGMRQDVLGVYLDADSLTQGKLVVTNVAPDTLASKLGVAAGDELLVLDGQKIASREDIARVLRDRDPKDRVLLSVRHQGGELADLVWRPE
ncbi:MAG: PDZ domain-containing protein [Planctomycetota bacterium]